MPRQRLGLAERRYLGGWAVAAAARLRTRGEEPTPERVQLLMADLDARCRRIFDGARGDSKARDALRKTVKRALEKAQKAQPPKVVAGPKDRQDPRLPPGVRYGETYPVRQWDPEAEERSWVKWTRRLVPGAPLVAFGAVLYPSAPLGGVLWVSIMSVTWLGDLWRQRRASLKARRERRVRCQFGLPTDPRNAYRLIVDLADGRSVVEGEYRLVGPP